MEVTWLWWIFRYTPVWGRERRREEEGKAKARERERNRGIRVKQASSRRGRWTGRCTYAGPGVWSRSRRWRRWGRRATRWSSRRNGSCACQRSCPPTDNDGRSALWRKHTAHHNIYYHHQQQHYHTVIIVIFIAIVIMLLYHSSHETAMQYITLQNNTKSLPKDWINMSMFVLNLHSSDFYLLAMLCASECLNTSVLITEY